MKLFFFKATDSAPSPKVGLRDVLRAPLTNLYLLQELQLVLDHLGVSREDMVLDVGCGAGTSTLVLSKYAKEVTGIDISIPIIQYLSSNYSSQRVKFLCLDACDTSILLPGGGFDKSVCIDTLGYVAHPRRLIQFISQNLREGGVLVLTTPVKSPLGRNEFTKEDIVSLFAEGDFEAEIKTLCPRGFARWLNKFYDFCQRVGAEKPKKEEELQGMDNRKFEDVAYPCLAMLQKSSQKRLILIKIATYFLFWLCQSAYRDDAAGQRFLVIARKKTA